MALDNEIIEENLLPGRDPVGFPPPVPPPPPSDRGRLKPVPPGPGPRPPMPPGPSPFPPGPPRPRPVEPPPPSPNCDPVRMSTEIQNMAQMRNYIKMMLGSPVICIEISDEQLNYIIGDAVRYVQRYYYGMGNYRDYLVMELVPAAWAWLSFSSSAFCFSALSLASSSVSPFR